MVGAGVPPSSSPSEAVVAATPPQAVLLIRLSGARIKAEPIKARVKVKLPPGYVAAPGVVAVELRLTSAAAAAAWRSTLAAGAARGGGGLADYELLAPVGKGASGRVYLARHRSRAGEGEDGEGGELVALKVMAKAAVWENADAVRHAMDERLVLELAADHPFILSLRAAFQTPTRLVLVTEFCAAGDLFDFMRLHGRPFGEPTVRRLVAEMVLALQHIHSLGVVYRDLKLENVLLDADGHVRIADFGLSKLLSKPRQASSTQLSSASAPNGGGSGGTSPPSTLYGSGSATGLTNTFCGTREMIAPEALSGAAYGQSVDVWALGILAYELLVGRTPFYSARREEVYARIESAPLRFPRHLSPTVTSLLRGLLDRNPATRLGMGPDGLEAVKRHPWFASVDWAGVAAKEPHPDGVDVVATLSRARTRRGRGREPGATGGGNSGSAAAEVAAALAAGRPPRLPPLAAAAAREMAEVLAEGGVGGEWGIGTLGDSGRSGGADGPRSGGGWCQWRRGGRAGSGSPRPGGGGGGGSKRDLFAALLAGGG
ncbi:hypothetical protein MMPV_007560 [Pyropia vietnamensis]